MTDEGLGQKLRDRRQEDSLSLREVAKRSDVNHGYLSQLERGEVTAPAPAILQRLAKGYGIPFHVLMSWAGYIESGLSANQQRALSYLGDDVSDQELELIRAFLDAIRRRRATFNSLDGELPDDEVERIRSYVVALLRRADALDRVPTPIDQVMEVARLVSVGQVTLEAEERRKLRERFGDLVDKVWSRLQGMIHFGSGEVWINPDMYPQRQRFVLGHEIGHYVLPEHREIFAYLDDETRLRPDVRDLFERQANQASIELLAQGDLLRREADDSALTVDLIDALADRYQISLQAAARRIVEETRQQCALAISFRGYTGTLMPHHLYCSKTFEERYRWKATGIHNSLIPQALAGRGQLEPLFVTDAAGCGVVLEVSTIRTPRAVLALFRSVPAKSSIQKSKRWTSQPASARLAHHRTSLL